MTKDVIALTPGMPDVWALLAGLYAGGPGMDITAAADGAPTSTADKTANARLPRRLDQKAIPRRINPIHNRRTRS